MATIDISTQSGAVGNGDLQLQNGVPMDGTLRFVTDALNTASPLKLSTSLVQTTSTLKITTNNNPYIDAEDGSGNNRFTVGRDPASQQVNVDFASNPTGSTTAVGAIRTYRDGTNLSEAMTFIEDGSVGIGTTAPVGILDLFKSAAATRLAIRGDAGQNRLISYRTGALQRFGLYVNNTAESGANAGSDFAIRAYSDAGTLLSTPLFIQRSSGNVGIGTTTPQGLLDIQGANPNSNIIASSGNAVSRLTDNATSVTRKELTTILDTTNNRVDIQAIHQGVATLPITINASGGNVGIGTTTPESKLHVADGVSGGIVSVFVDNNTNALNSTAQIKFTVDGGGSLTAGGAAIQAVNVDPNFANTDLVFRSSNIAYGSLAEIFRLTDGNRYLRMASGTGGIQFNGDTAAANALDDYEEGDWTMGIAFSGGSTGITYSQNTGTYTKIGRQVTVNGFIQLTSKGSSTGNARITGLPFTIPNLVKNNCAASTLISEISFLNQFMAQGQINTTTIGLYESTSLGSLTFIDDTNFVNTSSISVSLTYFV
jgi:hypothetical protein